MNKKKTQKSFNQGKQDKKKKVHKPPSKGTSKTKSSIVGGLIGAAISGPAVILGTGIGYLLGDSKKELKDKKDNRKAYYAGKNSPPKKGKNTKPKR